MSRLLLVLAMALSFVIPGASWKPEPAHAQAQTQDSTALQRIQSTIQTKGRARVIVELRLPAGQHVPEGFLGSKAAIGVQRQDIANAGGRILSRVLPTGARMFHKYDSLPFVALEIDAAGLAQLQASGLDVSRIVVDEPRRPLLFQSGPLVQAPQAWAAGFDGTGWVVAIIDSGVESSHPFLTGKVVSEACFVSGGGCPGGANSANGPGSGLPANGNRYHGTHVAGVAAGNAANAVPAPPAPLTAASSGIAKGAQIISINVFGPFSTAQTSDVMAALNRVFSQRLSFNIAAVNLSLGSDGVTNLNCNSDPMKSAIDQLRSAKIATVAASGNDYTTSGMNSPACISSAVSVGAVDKNNVVAPYSNVGAFMSLFAPGGAGTGNLGDIFASLLNGTYGTLAGTSRSTPHVTGAWAVLKQAAPSASVTEILTALQTSGLPVPDTRSGGSYTKPTIRIAQALTLLVPVPASVSPATAGIGATLSVVITGSNFQSGASAGFGSGVLVNGTTLNSSTQLTANITIQANATPGLRNVTVTNSDGRFATLTNGFTITSPVPTITSLSPNPVNVGGGNFTLTVTGASFASNSVVRLNGADRSTTFVSSSQLRASILAGDIAVAGTQSIAVFTPGGGTTPAMTLNVSNPAPTLSSISPSTVAAGGPAFTLTANGSNFVNGSVVRVNGASRPTTFVSPTQLTAALPASDLATTATSLSITVVTSGPGGGTSGARTLTLTVPPSGNPTPSLSGLTPTSVAAGSPGFGLTFFGSGFVAGTTATVNGQPHSLTVYSPTLLAIAIPATDVLAPGTLTIRVTSPAPCVNGLCTSNTLTLPVTGAGPTPSLSGLTPTSVAAGSPGFGLTFFGSGFVPGTTATVNGQPHSLTVYSPTLLAIAIPATDVLAPGTLAIRVTNPAPCVNGICTSNTLTLPVTGAGPTPSLSGLTPTSVAAGSPGFGLTFFGSGFVPGTTATVNGQPHSLTVYSPTLLAIAIPATDVLAPGTLTIRVTNPAPCVNGLCTSNTLTLPVTGAGPTPSLSGLTPTSVAAGSPGFGLTFFGSGFVPGTTATVNGQPHSLTVYSPTLLAIAIPATDVLAPGTLAVQVTNPGPCVNGLCTSNTLTLPVTGAGPTPSLSGLTPTSVAAGSPGFGLTFFGSGFVPGTTATVNGQPHSLTVYSPTLLAIAIPATDIAAPGTLAVQVTNPAPCVNGLCTSNTFTLPVTGANGAP